MRRRAEARRDLRPARETSRAGVGLELKTPTIGNTHSDILSFHSMSWSRRDILTAGLASPFLLAVASTRRKNQGGEISQRELAGAPGRVVSDDVEAARMLALVRKWDGPFCRST